MKSGLSLYINGKQQAQDKGGVGVQNMKDWTQQENFFLGRNVGGTGQVFTNFYIASFVVFNSYLEAPAVYSVSQYYSNDGEISVTYFNKWTVRRYFQRFCSTQACLKID